MKKVQIIFVLIFLFIVTLWLWPAKGQAANSWLADGMAVPMQQDDPAGQCAQGVELFSDGQDDDAFALLEAGFAGRESATFADLDDKGMCALVLGILYDERGDLSEALEVYLVAGEIFQNSGNQKLEATTLNNVGFVYRIQGKYKEAHKILEQALSITRAIPDRSLEGVILDNIGVVYQKQGKYEQALDVLTQALEIYEKLNNPVVLGRTLDHVGDVYFDQENYDKALELYRQALPIRREVGDQKGEAITLNNIGMVYLRQEDLDLASESFRQALEIARELEEQELEEEIMNNIGQLDESGGDTDDDPATLCAKGQELYLNGQDEEALPLLEAGFAGRENASFSNLNDKGDCALNLAGLRNKNGELSGALEAYQVALEVYQASGYRVGEGIALARMGLIYFRQGELDLALEYNEEALEIHRQLKDCFTEKRILTAIGAIYQRKGEPEKAQEILEQASSLSCEDPIDALDNPVAQCAEGVRLFSDGQHADALAKLSAGFAKRESGTFPNQNDKGLCALLLGILRDDMSDYSGALEAYQVALEIFQATENRFMGSTLTAIGEAYRHQGRYKEALNNFNQALQIARDQGHLLEEATTLDNMGLVHQSLGDDEEALHSYQDALEIFQKIKFHVGEAATLNNIGAIHESQRRLDLARNYYEQGLSVVRKMAQHAGEGSILNNIGGIYLSQGDYERALDRYEQALEIATSVGDRAGESVTLSNIGVVYSKQKQYEEALTYFQQAVEVIEEIRSNIKVEELKSSFTSERVSAYGGTIDLLMLMNRPEDAFHYVQRAKARTFLDQMANVRIDPKATDDPELLKREQELLGEIRALEEVLFGDRDFSTLSVEGTTRDGPSPLTGEQRNEVQARLEAAYDEYEQLLIDIKLTNPQYASLRSVQASTLITVQQTLPPDTTLVEYYVAPTQTLAFVVTPDEFHSVPISITAEALNSAVTGWRSYPALDDSVPPPSFELYDLLVAPIREQIDSEALIIAQADVLHYLPFGALHDGERYLVEDLAITYLPSASVLRYVLDNVNEENEEASGQLLALANPDADGAPYLTHAVAESEVIAGLFNSQALTGTLATETVLVDQAPQASRVHLAAHGQFNQHAPQFSRIILSEDEKNDGYLELHEIFSLDLPQTDLVTLSACQTQLGTLSAGDELEGLSRAFIYAGTPSLIASLWSVDDASTRFLMERFYGYLQAGKGKASALRQAQLDTMEQYANPYHWAAFTLIGDMGEVEPIKDVTDQEPDVSAHNESEKIEDEQQDLSTSEVENVPTADRDWLWLGGAVLILLLVVGGGVWRWKGRSKR